MIQTTRLRIVPLTAEQFGLLLYGKRKMKDYTIRQEAVADYDEIYLLIKSAFETAEVSDGDEQDYAVQLRKKENYIPELALVAEQNGKLIGHIVFTKTTIHQPDGTTAEVLLLSPLSVLYEYRNRGVGATLIYEGIRLSRKMGFIAVFLCGDPAYYTRFGFRPAMEFGIRPNNDIPPQYVLAYEIYPDALKGVSGLVDCC